MKNEKQTSNLNFNVQLFWKSEKHLFWCFLFQFQYRNENQNFISNFVFQFIKKTKWQFGYTDLTGIAEGSFDSRFKDFLSKNTKKRVLINRENGSNTYFRKFDVLKSFFFQQTNQNKTIKK